jgi:hypothetical protein
MGLEKICCDDKNSHAQFSFDVSAEKLTVCLVRGQRAIGVDLQCFEWVNNTTASLKPPWRELYLLNSPRGVSQRA